MPRLRNAAHGSIRTPCLHNIRRQSGRNQADAGTLGGLGSIQPAGTLPNWVTGGVPLPPGYQPPPYNPSDPNNRGDFETVENWQKRIGAQGQQPTSTPPVAGTQPGPGATAGGGAAPSITNPNDPQQVQAYFAWLGTQPNTDPILKTPEGQQYYTHQALSTGGLTDTKYWTNKATLASAGGAVGAGGAGGGGYAQGGPFGAFSPPTGVDEQNDPGYQFRIDQGNKAIQSSAAARGTLLTGGTLKALAGYSQGLASNEYGNVFNRALQTNQQNFGINQGNFGNLYNLSNLGMNAVTGAAS